MVLRLEGGAMYSLTVRDIYRKYHDLDVGLYTIGPCEAGPDKLAPGTSIGRYSSIYYTVRTMCGRINGSSSATTCISATMPSSCPQSNGLATVPSSALGQSCTHRCLRTPFS